MRRKASSRFLWIMVIVTWFIIIRKIITGPKYDKTNWKSHLMYSSLINFTSNNVQEKDVDRRSPLFVLLLSYQRSGSTYVSHLFKDTSLLHKERNLTDLRRTPGLIDHLMNVDTTSQSDRVFFLYEPLDPLYTAMFGTQQAWNTGGDIFSYENGTLRTLPEYELTAVTWYLNKIFQCQMADLPPGVLMHKFWNGFRGSMPLVHQYASCVSGSTGLDPEKWHLENDKCQKHVRRVCGVHFGQKRYNQEHVCRKNLWGVRLDLGNYQPNAVRFASGFAPYPDGIKSEFRSYFGCLARYRNVTRMCAGEFFDKPCRMASIRAIKTVRATMEVARDFQKRYDNFRVIHSFREPRALVSSHLRARWAANRGAGRNITRLAADYCKNLFRDILIWNEFSPDRAYRILYDHFVRTPAASLRDAYAFLNRTIPPSVVNEFRIKEKEKGTYIKRSLVWQHQLKKKQSTLVQERCSGLIAILKNYQHLSYFL